MPLWSVLKIPNKPAPLPRKFAIPSDQSARTSKTTAYISKPSSPSQQRANPSPSFLLLLVRNQVVELDWLRPHATIIASGSDQPTKNEIPAEVQYAYLAA